MKLRICRSIPGSSPLKSPEICASTLCLGDASGIGTCPSLAVFQGLVRCWQGSHKHFLRKMRNVYPWAVCYSGKNKFFLMLFISHLAWSENVGPKHG